MNIQVNLWTIIIVIIVGLYDLACAFNRRGKKSAKAYAILGLIFVIGGLIGLVWSLVK
jgi:RsiW-degrading membrane proteinase PrsW (M82 family)